MYEVGEYFELIALTSFPDNFRIVLETESDVKIHVIEPTTGRFSINKEHICDMKLASNHVSIDRYYISDQFY